MTECCTGEDNTCRAWTWWRCDGFSCKIYFIEGLMRGQICVEAPRAQLQTIKLLKLNVFSPLNCVARTSVNHKGDSRSHIKIQYWMIHRLSIFSLSLSTHLSILPLSTSKPCLKHQHTTANMCTETLYTFSGASCKCIYSNIDTCPDAVLPIQKERLGNLVWPECDEHEIVH